MPLPPSELAYLRGQRIRRIASRLALLLMVAAIVTGGYFLFRPADADGSGAAPTGEIVHYSPKHLAALLLPMPPAAAALDGARPVDDLLNSSEAGMDLFADPEQGRRDLEAAGYLQGAVTGWQTDEDAVEVRLYEFASLLAPAPLMESIAINTPLSAGRAERLGAAFDDGWFFARPAANHDGSANAEAFARHGTLVIVVRATAADPAAARRVTLDILGQQIARLRQPPTVSSPSRVDGGTA